MQHKSIQLTDLRVGTKGGLEEGQFIGYASVFGNVDLHGDITAKGAFADSLDAWAKSDRNIPILYGHRDDDPDYNVGHVISAKEDDRGLLITGQLDLDSPKGAQTYRLVKGRRLSEMSFAYEVEDSAEVKGADGTPANELRKLKLFEVSLVPQGANPQTSIVTVKSAPKAVDYPQYLAKAAELELSIAVAASTL
ncbi:HK97 family phage prohead protease [Rhodococcus sp. MSC1_016]|jgi:HK97 family phage prohead protease|uniref:HK97 family phage prohead protease n=1 Tax=Rhodococcus sp. MSC1_016 TaxID=2909266 RepID=UPI00202EA816|nr:HK97 family phage prohead protease [Rhodococcus sp. MSC1_016]